MNRLRISSASLFVMIILSACGSGNTPAVILTPEPSQPVDSIAAQPRQVEVVTPTTRSDQPPVISPTRLPPLDLEGMTIDSWFSISPDGKWTAQVQVAYPFDKNGVSTGDRYYVRLEILKEDGTQQWLVLDEWKNWGLGYSIPSNFHWRSDSRRLYYSDQEIADGCLVFGNNIGLFEVNLENGEVGEISGGAQGELEAAPDGLRIAILSGKTLSVRSLEGGKTIQVNLNFLSGDWQAGKLLWSPDEKTVVFTVLFKPCGPPESSSVYRMNTRTGELTSLINMDKRVFVASQWLSNGLIELIDQVGAKFRINPDTLELTPIQ